MSIHLKHIFNIHWCKIKTSINVELLRNKLNIGYHIFFFIKKFNQPSTYPQFVITVLTQSTFMFRLSISFNKIENFCVRRNITSLVQIVIITNRVYENYYYYCYLD